MCPSWRCTPVLHSTVRTAAVVLLVAHVHGLVRPLRRPAPALLQDREATWSNPQGASLSQIAEDVWLAERPFYPRLPGLTGTDVGCKACIVRLPDGKLWVHAPVGLDDGLRQALAQLGPVGHIVTPNTEHQLYAPSWILQYPEALSYAVSGEWSAVSGQRSAVSGQRSVVSGHWSVVSGQWALVGTDPSYRLTHSLTDLTATVGSVPR